MSDLVIKRVYDPADQHDGYRILVDRLWPRGLRKSAAGIDEWMKEAAPSAALRKWYDHDPVKWEGFQRAYTKELGQGEAATKLLALLKKHKKVTLLYAARDEQHNQAVVLAAYLMKINP